ncbi:S-layer homology domain-containing protein [Paenibacillus sp. GCM10027626]|uniref:S-layer homology domain-containing protein n=1 Tax=Paenibacillus sp. GCM10027626 TaxID=3273411 RepID=UPI003638CED5
MFRKWISGFVVFTMLVSVVPATLPSVSAADSTVVYNMLNADFDGPLAGTWDSTGAIQQQNYLSMKPGSAIWQGIRVTNDDRGPSVADIVYAEAEVTIDPDATADANVLVRINDGGAPLAEVNDLSAVDRGETVKLTTQTMNNGGRIGEGKPTLYVVHNDTQGTIDIHGIKLWGVREDGTRIEYPLENARFASPPNGRDWGTAGSVERKSALLMHPGSSAWRSLAVGDEEKQPHAGDKMAISASLLIPPSATVVPTVVARVHDGAGTLLEINDLTAARKGIWSTVRNETHTPVPDGAKQLRVELRNDGDAPVRITNVLVTGTRENRTYDLNGDGIVDDADLAYLEEAVANHSGNLAFDFDKDGELTEKDVSFFRKYALEDPSEVYVNFDHFRFINEKVTIDGIPMFISHLYAEPLDRNDLSKGYKWVGDPQEGVSALDDVARAVIVYVEHYNTYHDAYSYEMIKRGLSFAMWMQSPEGDFDNFVAEDEEGRFYKKDSHSSYTDFSFWAIRAYEAMAAAMPVFKREDADFAAAVQARLELCLERLRQKVEPNYGRYRTVEGKQLPAWLLLNDNWLTSGAISALSCHLAVLPEGSQRETALRLISMLGEGLAQAQSGDFVTYPLSGFMHSGDTWYEWGSIQVKAMALAGKYAERPEWIQAAEQAADSFLSDLLISGRAFQIAPNKSPYPQINYGTASYVENLITLYQVTGKVKYAQLAGIAATWWTGNNREGVSMFNQSNGAVYDGLTDSDVNTNSGAESVDEALRAILRIKRIPAALRLMTGTRIDSRGVSVVEAEHLFRQGAQDDTELFFDDQGLNDATRALRKQSNVPQTDETAVYEDATAVDTEQEIYPGWFGKHAIFVEAIGHNNVRIYDSGYLYRDIPVGSNGQFQIGDSVKLDFMGLLQFDADLTAEVLAVNAQGETTLLADDSAMSYLYRTWYSGQSTIKTTPQAQIPAGTVKLRVKFSNSSVNPNPAEGYVTITQPRLFRISVPEIRYGSAAFSGGSYVHMAADQSRTFEVHVPAAGDYDIYASAVLRKEADAAQLKIKLNDGPQLGTKLSGTEGKVAIVHLGSVHLAEGDGQLMLSSDGAAADVDAIYLYPAESWSVYRTVDGGAVKIVRDSYSRTLFAGTPEQADARDRIHLAGADYIGEKGGLIRISGIVTKSGGSAASMTIVRVGIGNVQAEGEVRTDANGSFTAIIRIPSAWQPGRYRVEAATDKGIVTQLVEIPVRDSGGQETEEPPAFPATNLPAGPGTSKPVPSGQVIVDTAALNVDTGGYAHIELPKGADSVMIMGDLSQPAFAVLEVKTAAVTLLFPASVLTAAYIKGGSPRKDGGITVRIVEQSNDEANRLLRGIRNSQVPGGGTYDLNGKIFRLELVVTGEDGRVLATITTFEKSVRLSFAPSTFADPETAGIYGLLEKRAEYAGGRLQNGFLTAELRHSGTYGVLTFTKQYKDVPVMHAAYNAIRYLTAKHVVQGGDNGTFRPLRALTRAEFAAMLARAFELPADSGKSAGFKDIPYGAWFAPYVAAVTEAGLFRGRSPEIFDPKADLSAAELRVLLQRVAVWSGTKVMPDLQLSGSEQEAVNRATAARSLYKTLKDIESAGPGMDEER